MCIYSNNNTFYESYIYKATCYSVRIEIHFKFHFYKHTLIFVCDLINGCTGHINNDQALIVNIRKNSSC